MVNMNASIEKNKALEPMIESIRDLYTLKLTLPLGNPNLKLVHTNQFLFTELPTDVFELANFDAIANALNSTYNRMVQYVLNKWYIEALTITNDGTSGKMEFTLNPFATTNLKYRENRTGYVKAYIETLTQNKTSNNNANNNNTGKKTVKSTATEIKLRNVKGFKKSDQEYIKKVVKTALANAKNPTKPVKVAKAIYEHYNKNHVYNGYECMKKMIAYGFEGCWKRSGHNCGDGASTMVAMFRCAGLNADIMHKTGHFYVRIKIDGTNYYCDQAGDGGQHNWRTLGSGGGNNNVYHGISSSASVVGYRYCN